jgi:hypothetical protein
MTERQTFNLVDMTVGMPYVLFGIYPAFMQDGNAPNTLVKGRCVYLYFGFKHIISEKLSDLARQGDLDYSNFAWSLGIGVTGSKF